MDYQLFEGDCLKLLADIPSGSVDMILCDLPYGTTQNKWDTIIPLEPLWVEYLRVCADNAAIVLTSAQPFTSKLVLSQIGLFKQELVWCKNIASDFLNANRRHMAKHENVLLFAKGSPKYNPQVTPGKSYTAHRKGRDDTGDNYGKIAQRTPTVNEGVRQPTTVLNFDRQVGLHPTQKPVALMEYLIRTYTNPREVVLDSCMGSGTTGVACAQTDRQFIGMEQDAKYFTLAKERIEQAYSLHDLV